MSQFKKLEFDKIKTYSITDRISKVNSKDFAKVATSDSTIEEFYQSLPNILVGQDFKEFISVFRQAVKDKKAVILMMGAHLIKCGLSPVIIELIKKGIITHVAMNGAGAIHDTEVAMWGTTSEDVAEGLKDGSFGMCKDTADFINLALKDNFGNDKGYGEVVAEKIFAQKAKNVNLSILANCLTSQVPVSVHPAIGTEITHQHPSLDGPSFGEKALLDFQVFTHSVAKLTEGGVVLNIGSAVILPEVFLKALTVVRNLDFKAFNFITAVFDMIRHYRPTVNVQQRPTLGGGKGYYFIGQHELMLPLLTALILKKTPRLK